MDNVVLVHDPYDVFLAVGFGFCYVSALLPAIRLLERYKKESELHSSPFISRCCQVARTHTFVFIRGVATIIGLACLYGWYSYYLKSFYPAELPAYRIGLDWIGLGLFAVGANYWDNEDHHEGSYCLIEGIASFVFGATCFSALPANPDVQAIPLLKAIFWCVIITTASFFYVFTTPICGKIFKSVGNDRRRVIILAIMFLVALLTAALLDWLIFIWMHVAVNLQKHLGWSVYSAAISLFVIIVVLVILTENKTMKSRVTSALLTIFPMGILIWVTARNYRTLFPHG